MPIPSFSDVLKSDEVESRAFRVKYLNSKLERKPRNSNFYFILIG